MHRPNRASTIANAVTAVALASFFLAAGTWQASAQDSEWRHGTALISEPTYPPDFPYFDYVNVNAPKGGVARLSDNGSFDTLNPILPKGETPLGLGLMYDTLMTSALDEQSAMYGQIAEAMRYPEDYSSVTFRLREGARWHDGTPITPEDVVWSFEKITSLNPSQRFYYQHVVKAEATGLREVTFTFDQTGNRELPHIVGQMLILPRHWWEGKDGAGNSRDIGSGTLEPPLGSGAYRIKEVSAGKTIVYERVADYWGADLPVNIGHNNFDEIRYETFRDETVEFEAFKSDIYDWRNENEAKRWATGYDFPAVRENRVIKEEFPNPYRDAGIMVGFVPNLRRPQFADPRVRQAINYAFDFEELKRTIFFGQYERIDSFFYDIPLRSSGLPEGRELEILESVRDLVPETVFTTPYENPVAGDPQKVRANLRTAVGLLKQAGYELQGNRQVHKETGKPLEFELLLNGPTIERVALPLQANLKRIGVTMNVRSVDTPQFINRVRSRDFDMIYTGWAQSSSPGNEQLDFWGSKAADSETSRNYGGIKDAGVDALIERLIFSTDRDDLIAATRALDRVLLHNHFVIPSYTLRKARIARWDRFSHPETLPEFAIGFPQIWWWDADKAARVEAVK